jgi:hypothetical protein
MLVYLVSFTWDVHVHVADNQLLSMKAQIMAKSILSLELIYYHNMVQLFVASHHDKKGSMVIIKIHS